jgi:uncharacterized membrane protein YhaH (DUF805 family)
MTLTSMLLSFKGRITRAQYWGYSLGVAAVLLAIFVVSAVAFNKLSDGGDAARLAFIFVSAPLYLLNLWCGICIAAKRYHDRNRSAWFLLLGLIPFIGGFILLADLGCLDGTQGPNRFGPSPKGIGGAALSEAFT